MVDFYYFHGTGRVMFETVSEQIATRRQFFTVCQSSSKRDPFLRPLPPTTRPAALLPYSPLPTRYQSWRRLRRRRRRLSLHNPRFWPVPLAHVQTVIDLERCGTSKRPTWDGAYFYRHRRCRNCHGTPCSVIPRLSFYRPPSPFSAFACWCGWCRCCCSLSPSRSKIW